LREIEFLEGERLDRRRLEEDLVVLDGAQPLEPEDRIDCPFLSTMEPTQPTRLGCLLGGLGGVPEAERLVGHRRRRHCRPFAFR
jgi:hypothetical protein